MTLQGSSPGITSSTLGGFPSVETSGFPALTKTVVVAKYNEDVTWSQRLPLDWDVLVVEKGVQVENEGREALSYLWAMEHLQSADDDILVFVQGSPFVHHPLLVQDLYFREFMEYTPLGNFVVTCDAAGEPHHPGLPVGESYETLFTTKFPGSLTFTAGAQFAVWGRYLPPKAMRDRLWDFSLTEHGPWLLERFWPTVFNAPL